MATYPTSPRNAFLTWCQSHAPVFLANATAIGLTAARATAFKDGVVAAGDAVVAQTAAKDAAKAATLTASNRFEALEALAAEMVRTIRTFAENQHNPNVYVIAQIPPPAPTSPMPAPAQPTELRAELDAPTGFITVRWKATQPAGAAGTSYLVRRRIGATGDFTFLGVTGGKRFVDDTFIAGPDAVGYTVQAQRSDASGPVSEILTVNFGRAPGGQLTITTETRRAA